MTHGSSCAFCGRSDVKMSREHIFPQWLSRAGSHAGNYIMHRGEKTVTTPLIEVVTKRVCVECNTGWLSRIETGAKAVLEPLLHSSVNLITETERWIIARWFTKTVLTAHLAMVSRSSPGLFAPQSYRDFYEKPLPVNNGVILISGYTGPILPIRFEVIEIPGSKGSAYRIFFHFHRLVLTGFVAEPDKLVNIVWPHNFHLACQVVTPMQRGFLGNGDPTLPCSWPPSYLLDQAAIENFLITMRGNPKPPQPEIDAPPA
jgi:hypothetical protein